MENKQPQKMNLTLQRIVKTAKQRSYIDKRRIVNVITAEYRGEDGHEYRKVFESYETPVVPAHGDNAHLTSKRIQWTS